MAATARPVRVKRGASRTRRSRRPRGGKSLRFAAGALLAGFLLGFLPGCSPTYDWREVHPAPGGFVIALPQRAHSEERDVALGNIKLPMTMTSTGIGPTLFAVGVARLPAGAPPAPQLLAWLRDGLVRNIGGTVVTEKPIGAPAGAGGALAAEELSARGTMTVDRRPVRLDARIYVFEDRLYSLSALSAEGELTPDLLDTFFSSFRIAGRS